MRILLVSKLYRVAINQSNHWHRLVEYQRTGIYIAIERYKLCSRHMSAEMRQQFSASFMVGFPVPLVTDTIAILSDTV